MARLSDFQVADVPMVVDQALMARNAKAAGTQTRYADTHIRLAPPAERQRVHQKLDRACMMDGEKSDRLHAALDRVLDEYEERNSRPSDEPEEEQDDNAEPQEEYEDEPSLAALQQAVDALLKSVARPKKKVAATAKVVAHDSGYITDSEFISKYLHPNKLCIEVENELRPRVMDAQADNAMRGYWAGLFDFLRNQPEGSRIKDIQNKACLSTLVSKTLAA